jgi:hypothetical protein
MMPYAQNEAPGIPHALWAMGYASSAGGDIGGEGPEKWRKVLRFSDVSIPKFDPQSAVPTSVTFWKISQFQRSPLTSNRRLHALSDRF